MKSYLNIVYQKKTNYQISVSFDVCGKSKDIEVDDFAKSIEKAMKNEFKKQLENVKIKNVKWNE